MSKEHFEIGAWIDFVRGISPPALCEQMRTHLTSGCVTCSELAAYLERVWTAGRRSEDNVPEAWVMKATAIFDDQTLGAIRFLPIHTAHPAFNSFKTIEVGVRTRSRKIGHLIFETDDCTVNLRLEPHGDSRELSIVGQVTAKEVSREFSTPIPIYMFRKNKLIAKTSSNEFGEFQFKGVLRLPLSISFPFEGYRVDVPLDDPFQSEETLS